MTGLDLQPLMAQIASHARSAYPAECCGLVVAARAGALRFVPIANIAGTEAAAGNSRRSRRDGYVMDPKALLAALTEAEEGGGGLAAIVHSHPDVGAYFSREDREMALGGGVEPLWPGVQYLVISCKETGVDAARLYTWDPARVDFAEEQVPVIA
ncbi:MAG TPA: M67 family metallopeptidase [Myxococcales bacterium]